MSARFTFAVIGHNEERSLPYALATARTAARTGDTVWFVDSDSTDGSASLAASLGVEVVKAPLGKGRAMQEAFDRSDDDYVCFVDADYQFSDVNIPARLRAVTEHGGHDMVIGTFWEPARSRMLTPNLYRPLMRALFPDVERTTNVPLSGFRVLRRAFPFGAFPPGYGVETFINIEAAMGGARVIDTFVGMYRGDLRAYRTSVQVAIDVVAAIFDGAERHGRIGAADRPLWDAWAQAVIDAMGRRPPSGVPDADFFAELRRVSRLPVPAMQPPCGAPARSNTVPPR